jgi:hypothetical protein
MPLINERISARNSISDEERVVRGDATIRSLRAILKILLRRHGFRCLSAEEAPAP